MDTDHDVPQFKTANEFSLFIEQLACERNLSRMETIIQFCDEHFIEPDEIASKISHSLRDKLEYEFQELNYLPKRAQLDM